MRRLAALALAVPLALPFALPLAVPAHSETLLSEVIGNWAGPSNGGFFFLARLTQDEDKARLTIWNGMADGPRLGTGDPSFDNPAIALGAFATRQELEVVNLSGASLLQVVTEFADEDAEGRTVVQIQYLDNQFTVVGYYHLSNFYNPGGEPFTYECDVDLWDLFVIENGQERSLPPMDFETLNASDWTWDAAFERGYCTRTE